MLNETQSTLGQKTAYEELYNPNLLFPIARSRNRQTIGINEKLPFMGVDIWNAYELSWLNPRGKPEIALGQFIIPADSPMLVESKSFKLYLNSFNQTKVTSKETLLKTLTEDLSTACQAPISIKLLTPIEFAQEKIIELSGVCIDHLDIEIAEYHLDPTRLVVEKNQAPIEETLISHLLKSNCLVTGQPDWGSLHIHYAGKPIRHESLLRYIIGFRQHTEFSEHCVERIFTDIMHHCKPSKLSVYARYTRRGGLDINPFRTNFTGPLPQNIRTARQ